MPHDLPGTAEQTTTTASWSILPQDSYQHPYQSGPTAQTFPYAATTTTVHNLLSEVVYFIARGSGFSGVLSVQDDGERGTSVLRVDVTMYYTHPYLAQCAQVYREQVWPERSGFKILTPRECGHEEMFFDVMVHLPPGASDRQWISKFESDLPQFSHLVGDLSQSIHFGQLLLRGTNGQIMSKSILADSASMCTSNAAIECDYVSARCLTLKTANGTINANISLLYTGGEASTLIIETSNGGITSTISLVSATGDRAGGTYIIAAKTSNGPIFMSFPQSPQSSTQYIDARTSNAPLFAKLHEAFEGEFRLRTSNGPSNIQRHQQAYDSSRWGRTRVIELGNSSMGATVGTATWGALPSGSLVLGRAIFETSNSSAQLTV